MIVIDSIFNCNAPRNPEKSILLIQSSIVLIFKENESPANIKSSSESNVHRVLFQFLVQNSFPHQVEEEKVCTPFFIWLFLF